MASRLLNLAVKHRAAFSSEFMQWLPLNQHMYTYFEKLADKLWEAGRRHYSARTIGEKMRFDHSVREVGGEFKLSNNAIPDLGRLYVLRHPKRVLLFEYRRTRLNFIKHICKQFSLTIVTVPDDERGKRYEGKF